MFKVEVLILLLSYHHEAGDRPPSRHLQLASCLHISGQEKSGLQARHLQLVSCLHFQKQDRWAPG